MSYIVIDWFNEEYPNILTEEIENGNGLPKKLETLEEAIKYSEENAKDPQIVNSGASNALFSEEDMQDFGNLIEERQKYSDESVGEIFQFYMQTQFKKKYEGG